MLNFLRTSPPPHYSPKYPLLPGHPPAAHLPLNPVLYLTLAVDSVAPLIRIKRLKGMAGGGTALEIPMPLPVRNRRRLAFSWILEAVARKPSRGSGKRQFAARLASEIISVVEGSSGVWDKRDQIHKTGMAARANLFLPQYRKSIK
jgi:small subunit ribosomal protein S7